MKLFNKLILSIILCFGILQNGSAQIISTFAGGGLNNGASAASVKLTLKPGSFAIDPSGNLFAADALNNRIIKISTLGIISTIAGNGTSGFNGDGALAINATLSCPSDVIRDVIGNLYIIDQNSNWGGSNKRIRKIATDGIITTVAGGGAQGVIGSVGSQATNVNFNFSQINSIAVDGMGNLFISDLNNSYIYKVANDGILNVYAGNGINASSGNGGLATAASISYPRGLCTDLSGNLYFCEDNNHVIRKINTSGIITTIAGGGSDINDGISALQAYVRASQICIDASNNIIYSDIDRSKVRKIDNNNIITTIAGGGYNSSDGIPAINSELHIGPDNGLALDASGNIYVQSAFFGYMNLPILSTYTIRKINTSGNISTVVGGTNLGDGLDAKLATLNNPLSIAIDGSSNIFVADQANNKIRKIAPSGIISTYAGDGFSHISGDGRYSGDGGLAINASLSIPTSIAIDKLGNLFIADMLNKVIRKIDHNTGIISTFAGTGNIGYNGDGILAINANLSFPSGIAFDTSNNLYIADQENARIRKVDAITGIISTIAGNGTTGNSGDGGNALGANIHPTGVAVDKNNNVYILDYYNYRVRKILSNGNIITFAGSSGGESDGDGGLAINAKLGARSPAGIAFDDNNNAYISSAQDFSVIRKVNQAGIISTIAGQSIQGFKGDGSSSASAQLNYPTGLCFDSQGNLYVADALNNRIRKITAIAIPAVQAPSIISFFPSSGPVGTLVTITGTNLSNPTSLNIGGVSAIPISNNGSTLVAMVMPGATTGNASVTTASGTATSSSNFTITSGCFPNIQQGNKLVGSNASGSGVSQGRSVAISADGNTAVVSGPTDNVNVGAIWVYTRSGGTWTQQGTKIFGTASSGFLGFQGHAVAISANGNTIMLVGLDENINVSLVAFTRNGSVWTQQGDRIVPNGNSGGTFLPNPRMIALSADGNTAIVGGARDNNLQGAAWVFTRNGNTWTQQGPKLVGTGGSSNAQQGTTVAISADGNTAIVGGPNDNMNVGAVWVYTRSGNTWTQQGTKLLGTGFVGAAMQGGSLALSADGNTAAIGGSWDNGSQGATWIFTRNGNMWTQQGAKIVGDANITHNSLGYSVSLSADGNTLIVGEQFILGTGGFWIYTRNVNTWTQQGGKNVVTDGINPIFQGGTIALSSDGSTVIIGGPNDNGAQGAAWIFACTPSPINTPPPTISSFNPSIGSVGTSVTITGNNFTGATAVKFGGTAGSSFTVINATTINAVVGTGASGNVSVTTPGGTATLAGFTFIDLHTQDSLALVALYNSTNGTNWTNKTNWLTSAPINTWYGVTVNNTGRVNGLNLSGNQLIGNIPTSIGNLTGLTYLHLFNNQLSGSIPVEIGNLTNLTELLLYSNQLTGSIPVSIGNLTNLTSIHFRGNQLSGSIPSSIGNLSSIKYLVLSANQLSGSIPSSIGNLTTLLGLDISDNQLTGNILSSIGNLTGLTYMHLYNNQLSGSIPSSIGNLINLTDLRIDNNQLNGSIPSSIGNLTKLIYLYLSQNQIAGKIPVEIGNLISLKYLVLYANQLSDTIPSSIGNLGSLIDLELGSNKLTGKIPNSISNLTNLQYLRVNNNKLVSPIPLNLANLPNINTIALYNNSFVFDGGLVNIGSKTSIFSTSYSVQNALYDSLNLYNTNGNFTMQLPIAFSGSGDTAMNGLKVDWYKNGNLFQSFSRFLTPNTKVTSISYSPANAQPTDVFYAVITNPAAPQLTLVTKQLAKNVNLIDSSILSGGGGVVSGGGSGGLESKDLGDAVAQRVYVKAQASLNGNVDYNKLSIVGCNQTAQPKSFAVGVSSVTLSSIMPDITKNGFVAYNSTPTDIVTITNAKEVIATDFTLNKQPKAVAFATKTLGAIYDHTKQICDRLKGGALLDVQNITVGGYNFIQYTIKDQNGQTEYATSFSVGTKAGRNNFSIQSNWLQKDYISDDVMYNFQLWAATPQLVNAMIVDVLTKVQAAATITPLGTSNIPATYIMSGSRTGTNLDMVVNNTASATTGYFTVEDKASESSTGTTATRQIPFTVNANGKSTVNIPMKDLYQSTITMYVNGGMKDVVYMSDGIWSVDYNNATSSVNSFTVSNDANRVYDSSEYAVLRNVNVKGNSSDYISIFKLMKGGGAEADLSAYKGLKLTASGGYSLRVTLVKNSITNWSDQYSTVIKLDDAQKDYTISLDKFISSASKDKIAASDITMVVFAIEVGTGRSSAINTTLSNISFTKVDQSYINSLESKEIQVYPNPATSKNFTCSFYSNQAQLLTLHVRDVMGRTIATKQVNAIKGLNVVPVEIKSGTNGIHIVSLDGADVKYNSKKIVIE